MAAFTGPIGFNAAAQTLLNLLTNVEDGHSVHYVVPAYQRAYVWGAEHARSLQDGLLETARLVQGNHGANEPRYFLGAVVVAPATTNQAVQLPSSVQALPANLNVMARTVVDGQQRLTTVLLLIAALRATSGDMDRDPIWTPQRNVIETNLVDLLFLTIPVDFQLEPVRPPRFSVRHDSTNLWARFMQVDRDAFQRFDAAVMAGQDAQVANSQYATNYMVMRQAFTRAFATLQNPMVDYVRVRDFVLFLRQRLCFVKVSGARTHAHMFRHRPAH
jgi:hypothetical protein